MKYRRGFWLACAILMSCAAGWAGTQGFKWWQDENTRQQLGLTAEQSTRIEQIYQATQPKLMVTKDDLDRTESELSRLINESTVTEAQVLQQIDRVEAARSELSKTRMLMLFHIRQVLSPEQRAKLKKLHEHREQGEKEHRKPSSNPR